MVIPTPPDATALVKVNAKGKLHFDTKAIAQENRELKDEVLALRSQLEELSKSPRSHPDPSPARDLLITEGLERVLCQSQYDSLCEFWLSKFTLQLEWGKRLSLQFPLCLQMFLDLAGLYPLRMAHLERIWLIPVFETVWGMSFGDGSEDDLEDISLDVEVG